MPCCRASSKWRDRCRMEHPTEQEHRRLSKLGLLNADEIGWQIVDLLQTATVLHRSALNAWLAAGAPATPGSVPEVQLYSAAASAVAEALRLRFSGTPLGPAQGPDVSGALWLIAARLC